MAVWARSVAHSHDQSFVASVTKDKRAARLASLAGIAPRIGYKRRPGRYGGKPSVVADNTLDWQFEVSAPDRVWEKDITYIKTHEGWSCQAVVIVLFSRRAVGGNAIAHDYKPRIASVARRSLAT